MTPPKVLLADDNPTVLEVVSRILTPEFEVVGAVADGRSLITETQKLIPDVVLVDLLMPDLNGLEVARELKKHHRTAKIIFLTVFVDSAFVEEARDIGAMGYVLKSSADRDLIPAIHEALEGRFFHSPSLQCERGVRS